MALKAVILGTKEATAKFKPFYDAAAKRGDFEIIAQAVCDPKGNRHVFVEGKSKGLTSFDVAIISPKQDFYAQMKLLEAQGFPRNRIIDGRVFRIQNLDFPRLLEEGVAHGVFEKNIFTAWSTIYPQVNTTKKRKITLSLGPKSYINAGGTLLGAGSVSLGKFSLFATKILFSLGQNHSHNYRNVGIFSASSMDWKIPREFYPPQGTCKIEIGNDVWCGQGTIFKCSNPLKPLIIGDGAVIAANSVVVKNIPPYAIVGGNPAKIIRFRFSEDVIESLLRIKWWDWEVDKLHDNFKYFNDVERFVSMFDK